MCKIRIQTEISQEYNHLAPFVSTLPETFQNEGEMIYEGRNTLKYFQIQGVDLVVKSFKKPHIINKIAYSFFRESKAKRSYLYALDLLKRGVETPAPIAYINEYKHGLLSRSYYICIYERKASPIAPYVNGDAEDKVLLSDMVRFIVSLHKKNVLHLDLSPGNVLVQKIEGQNKFSVIDINRLKIEDIDKNKAYRNFARLSRNRNVSTAIAEIYADEREWDREEAVQAINKYSDDFFRFKTYSFARKEMKKYYGTFRSFCGHVQLYRFVSLIRKLTPFQKLKQKLFNFESDLYFKYIMCSDVRRVLMSENHYEENKV
ncbi:MAG: lipopolysaccharide kinase InaA family protein [Bacteroidales bacterium]